MSQSSNTSNDQDLPLWFTIPVQILIWIVATALSLFLRLLVLPLYTFFTRTSLGSTLWVGGFALTALCYAGQGHYLMAFGLFLAAWFWCFVGVALEAFWDWCDRKAHQ